MGRIHPVAGPIKASSGRDLVATFHFSRGSTALGMLLLCPLSVRQVSVLFASAYPQPTDIRRFAIHFDRRHPRWRLR